MQVSLSHANPFGMALGTSSQSIRSTQILSVNGGMSTLPDKLPTIHSPTPSVVESDNATLVTSEPKELELK